MTSLNKSSKTAHRGGVAGKAESRHVHQSSIERFSKPSGVGHPHQNRGGRPQAVSVLAIRDLAGAKKAASDLAEKATPAKCVMTAKHADLPPAAYTAIVSGVNGTGVALVEVYALP